MSVGCDEAAKRTLNRHLSMKLRQGIIVIKGGVNGPKESVMGACRDIDSVSSGFVSHGGEPFAQREGNVNDDAVINTTEGLAHWLLWMVAPSA
jgi:hypothetical protein